MFKMEILTQKDNQNLEVMFQPIKATFWEKYT